MASTDTKTIDDAITEIRQILNDVGVAGSPYRFSQQLLVTLLNTAFREVYRYRPDAFIGNFTQGALTNNAVVTYAVSDLGTSIPFPIDDRVFYTPVVSYVVGRAELGDDEFLDNNRAMTLLGMFKAELTGA